MTENQLPFKRDKPGEDYDEDVLARYLSQIHAVLGPPPADFLEVLEGQPFWDDKGAWIYPSVDLPEVSLMQKLERIEEADREATAEFLLCMLKWLPTQRLSAEKLLEHEWLKT